MLNDGGLKALLPKPAMVGTSKTIEDVMEESCTEACDGGVTVMFSSCRASLTIRRVPKQAQAVMTIPSATDSVRIPNRVCGMSSRERTVEKRVAASNRQTFHPPPEHIESGAEHKVSFATSRIFVDVCELPHMISARILLSN